MFDHVAINVSDMDASRRFFEQALAPLGYEVSFDSPHWVGMGAAGRHDFGLVRRDPVSPAVHLAFEALDRATVDAFYEAALAAGGTDNGAPGLREDYGEHYYAAFVLGPDGHNVEAVTQKPEPIA
jgi:catechol 2,3-dioxygenase-like lactoylglutathione lyase family enzyme